MTPRERLQHHTTTTSHPGVSYCHEYGMWQAHILIRGRSHFLGFFLGEHHAIARYRQIQEALVHLDTHAVTRQAASHAELEARLASNPEAA